MASESFLTLEPLALTLGVPLAWLRREVEEGRIPYLDVGRRRLFDVETVREALRDRCVSADGAKAVQQ